VNSDPVRFGIVGCGRIAQNAIAPAIRAVPDAVLAAAASRDRRRAAALMPHRAYGDFAALLADAEVEVVYVASHNGQHRDLTLAALAAGKHVLCEKPLGRDPAEVVEMTRAAAGAGRALVEAFMYRFHPQIRMVKDIVAAGEIGEVRRVDSVFTFLLEREDDVRLVAEWGGGALLDVGCYCVDFARALLGSEPERVIDTRARFHLRGADLHVQARLEYAGGTEACFECGFDAAFAQRAVVRGTAGAITLEHPWISWQQHPRVTVETPAGCREVDPGLPDPYALEIEHMARLVRGREPARFPLSDTLATSRMLERILQAAEA
jgi:predicted dehydrogenase